MLNRTLWLGILSLLLAACEGNIGGAGLSRGDGSPAGNAGPPGFGSPSETSLLRLTKEQHQRTVYDLLSHFLGTEADSVYAAVEPAYAVLPDDPSELKLGELVGSSFNRMSQTVGELHVRGYFGIAAELAAAIVSDDARRSRFFGNCIEEPSSDHTSCIEPFIREFGLWTLRRPLRDDEYEFFLHTVFADDRSSYEATPTALNDLIVAFLMAPDFVYRTEGGGNEVGNGIVELDAYGLANRLSYHFWGSMPDAELFAAAEDGSLMTESGYAAQVERVYADERTQQTFTRFFSEWLELYRVGDPFGGVSNGDPRKIAFIEGYRVTPELRDNMVNEVLDMAEYYRENGTFEDLFTSTLSFARTEDLAAIYEVPMWDGGEPTVEFPSTDRVGLLGRAALLSAATVSTHPILRGVRIRENFMCDSLGTPPANVDEGVEDLVGDVTTRERIESLTSPGGCAGCHQFINGLGFPLEVFDSLGRHRSEEMVIDGEGAVTLLPVDPVATPAVLGSNDQREVSGPPQLVEQLLSSGKLESCFARHYVRFALGVSADPGFGGDAQTTTVLAEALADGEPLAEVFKQIAFLPAFKQRLMGDQA